jgi:hypothetical protein
MNDLELLLLRTPSLTHFKLISSKGFDHKMFDGFRWEHFIRMKLPLLNQFDILLSYHHNKNSDIISLESVIIPFQTPFWLEEKCWFATCDYVIGYSRTRLYTKSICVDKSQTNNKCQVT